VRDYLVYIAAGVIVAWPYIVQYVAKVPALFATKADARWRSKWLDTLMTLEAKLVAEGCTQAAETCRELCVQLVQGKK
jgi:hypothetical protein